MNLPTDYSYVADQYPDLVVEALADLQASRSKAKATRPEGLDWSWNFARRLKAWSLQDVAAGSPQTQAPTGPAESLRESDPQRYCDEKLRLGEFLISLRCQGTYGSTKPPNRAPREIVESIRVVPVNTVKPRPEQQAMSLYVYAPSGTPPGIHQHLVVAGFVQSAPGHRGAPSVHVLIESGPIRFLYQLDRNAGNACFEGMLTRRAQSNLDSNAEGAQFKLGKMTCRRLSGEEIRAVLQCCGERYAWGIAPPGMPARGVEVFGRPKPTTPVWGADAIGHPNPKPLGTAADLGLSIAPLAIVADEMDAPDARRERQR